MPNRCGGYGPRLIWGIVNIDKMLEHIVAMNNAVTDGVVKYGNIRICDARRSA